MSTRTTRFAPFLMLAIALAALAGPAHVVAAPGGDDPPPPATDAPPAPPAPPGTRPASATLGLVSRPSLATVFGRFMKSGLPDTVALVWADFDGDGKVLSARLIRGTGNESLDRAILYWARMMVVRASEPGGGLMPVVLRIEDNIRQAAPPLPVLGDEVVARAREAGLARVTGAFTFRDSAFGKWSPGLKTPTGHKAVDDALLAWARSLPPESLGTGTLVYPFDESTDPDDRAQLVRVIEGLMSRWGNE